MTCRAREQPGFLAAATFADEFRRGSSSVQGIGGRTGARFSWFQRRRRGGRGDSGAGGCFCCDRPHHPSAHPARPEMPMAFSSHTNVRPTRRSARYRGWSPDPVLDEPVPVPPWVAPTRGSCSGVPPGSSAKPRSIANRLINLQRRPAACAEFSDPHPGQVRRLDDAGSRIRSAECPSTPGPRARPGAGAGRRGETALGRAVVERRGGGDRDQGPRSGYRRLLSGATNNASPLVH